MVTQQQLTYKRQWYAGRSPEQRDRCRATQREYYYRWPWEKAFVARKNAVQNAKRYGQEPGSLNKEIFARLHLLPCAYCGVMPAMGVDHVLALSRGGTNTIENLVPACLKCNQQKGARW